MYTNGVRNIFVEVSSFQSVLNKVFLYIGIRLNVRSARPSFAGSFLNPRQSLPEAGVCCGVPLPGHLTATFPQTPNERGVL